MKIDIITTKNNKNFIKITGENDFYLSNGSVWSDRNGFVFLGKYEDINNWWETKEEPPQPEETE